MELTTRHSLDTGTEEYYRILRETVIPICAKVAPGIPDYPKRIEKIISYNVPAFDYGFNFGVELAYRCVAPPNHQTKDNLTKAKILRIVMDLMFGMSAVLDDIADKSATRRGVAAWHRACPGGVHAAMYDGILLGWLPFHLLKHFFREEPGYPRMLEAVAEGNMLMLVGETVDMEGQGRTYIAEQLPLSEQQWRTSGEQWRTIAAYKAGHFVKVQASLALSYAGIFEDVLIDEMREIFSYFGVMLQIWDDFSEYYCGEERTGKPRSDFANAALSWTSSTAASLFNQSQAHIFTESYGSPKAEDVARIRRLYDKVDMPGEYVAEMSRQYRSLSGLIQGLGRHDLRQLCFSYLNWLIGGAAHLS